MRLSSLGWSLSLLFLASCGSTRSRRDGGTEPLTAREKHHLASELEQMAVGWDGMTRGKARDRRQAEENYEQALADFLKAWSKAQSPRDWQNEQAFQRSEKSTRFVVELDKAHTKRPRVSPLEYDDFIMPRSVIPHSEDTEAVRAGVGVPLVGRVERTEAVKAATPFLPPKGGNDTLTATMHFSAEALDGSRRCHLRLHDTLNTDTVEAPGGERQLAAHFTAPKHLALSRRAFGLVSLQGLLYPEKALGDCQLYRMDAYDPNRIPVVFVHGLMSDPHIWLNAVNAICADPVLRKKYQPWYFLYPTAMGVPQAAAMLRKSLEAARNHFDPDHNDPGMSRMVLVGHSMGGLLSRMQVTDSGSHLWDGIFRKPPAQMNVSEEARTNMTAALFVKPLPYVERVIFIATPHRGSTIASLNIVRRLTSLIRIPLDSLTIVNQILYGNTDALSPQITKWGVFSFVSIGMLSEQHPFLKGLDQTRPTVSHHSVIGNRGRRGPLEQSGDGVVPYWSSHLDTAKSEQMVPHGHGCVEDREVVQEVVRLLKEHVRSK
ncbi:MAG: hypothetical protein IPK22_10705 [Verrucomicrobiaceae bacterium]|nr:hypothetical protein [Verrucomicrobiaceae bacterium]